MTCIGICYGNRITLRIEYGFDLVKINQHWAKRVTLLEAYIYVVYWSKYPSFTFIMYEMVS